MNSFFIFCNLLAAISFQDVTPDTLKSFILRNSPTPARHQIETMPGGLAVLDFDNDGRLDLYFVNAALSPSLDRPDASFSNRLFRNLGNFRFEDVTARAGVAGAGYGMGAAAADYDADGFTDLFVTGVGKVILYRNRGDGTFEDVTKRAGLTADGRWSIAAGWFDYDKDGDLDLFIVNYVVWDPLKEPFCGDPKGAYRTYCHPKHYQGEPNALYRNNGDGTFTDVSAPSGIAKAIGKGMGAAFADYDADGHIDVLVANDTEPNFLFRNLGNGRFQESALEAGVAFNDDGRAVSSMGVDFRDFDNDGRPDIFVTALANETFPLFRNLGKGMFQDVTYLSGVGRATLAFSGWGNMIADFDNDGFKDLFTANGDVNFNTEQFSSRLSRQSCLILRNLAGKSFEAFSATGRALHRGAAIADFDGDGRLDIALTRLEESPLLLRNTSTAGNWLRLALPIGAQARIETASGTQWNHATTSVGYASSSEPLVHFGLGKDTTVRIIEVRFPAGAVKMLENVKANRVLTVTAP
jgi:hypothetical protein